MKEKGRNKGGGFAERLEWDRIMIVCKCSSERGSPSKKKKEGGEEKGEGTYSAAKVLLCIRSRSTSAGLCTRKALWPEGIMWRVFLLEPNPI